MKPRGATGTVVPELVTMLVVSSQRPRINTKVYVEHIADMFDISCLLQEFKR